ncbi:MAG: ECF transporter S component [Oscillospiraceae bacterium]|nr:ECF transporter S component [Oscillospiraceae bacterium]MDD7278133.1 ECF transporter S component [Oscillospiraceae bacterium]MDY2864852.1 ECF transporter S component [Oscillospiraceae bacterium]
MAETAAKASSGRRKLYSIIIVGLMAALVYVGNYLQIKIPNGALVTRIHLGNSMCLLAGLLFGRLKGGLASGIGAGLYDLFDPVYIVSAPYTFFSKFAMGFTAGHIRKHGPANEKKAVIVGAIVGQLVYIVLYLLKTFISQILLGEPVSVALKLTGVNAITSTVNGVLACVIAIPLYFALSKALAHTGIAEFITEKEEKKGWFNPLTAGLTIFAIVVTTLYTIDLANTNKVEKKQAEKEAAYAAQIDDLQYQIDYLTSELGIEIPEKPAEEDAAE